MRGDETDNEWAGKWGMLKADVLVFQLAVWRVFATVSRMVAEMAGVLAAW